MGFATSTERFYLKVKRRKKIEVANEQKCKVFFQTYNNKNRTIEL